MKLPRFGYTAVYNSVKRLPTLTRLGDIMLVAVWPFIMPGDQNTNYLQLGALTHGDYTLKSFCEGVRNTIIPTAVHYLPILNRLF